MDIALPLPLLLLRISSVFAPYPLRIKSDLMRRKYGENAVQVRGGRRCDTIGTFATMAAIFGVSPFSTLYCHCVTHKTFITMAKISQGIMGAFNGTVGPVVGYEWKGRSCMRGRVAPRNPRTECQQRGRSVFGIASHLWGRMRSAAEIGLRGQAQVLQISETNLFVRLNRQCISIEDGEVEIAYSQLRLAEGALAGVVFAEPSVAEGARVGVDFSPEVGHAGCSDDYVFLFAYAPMADEGRLSMPVKRSGGHVELLLPEHWHGGAVYLYGFAWDRALAASASTYIGSL